MNGSKIIVTVQEMYLEVASLLQSSLSMLDVMSDEEVMDEKALSYRKGYSAAIGDVGDIIVRQTAKIKEILDEED